MHIRLKTRLRSQISRERLVGLVLLRVHGDFEILIVHTVNRFFTVKNKSLDCIL